MKPGKTISRCSKKALIAISIIATIALASILFYQIPWVHDRLGWRLDIASTYILNVFHPAGDVPTASINSSTQTTTYTPSQSMAITSTPSPVSIFTSSPSKTPNPTPTPTLIPSIVKLKPPEFNQSKDLQDWNNCGPASLALYLRYYGWGGDQFTISSVLKPIRADRNVNIDELQYYVRTQAGWLNAEYRVGGTLDLLKRIIAAGYPVLIEESFQGVTENYWPNDDRWMGHYLLLTGFDDTLRIFIAQDSFHGSNQIVNYIDIDKNWQAFNRVYMIVYPVQQDTEIQRLLGEDWDVDMNRQKALAVSESETSDNPENAFAWFNLGTNLTYFDKFSQAAEAYDKAREIGLPQRMLRYQFGPFIAYFNSARNDDLLALTEYALMRTPNSEEALVWYGWALYRAGDKIGAIAEFEKALEAHHDYAEAIYGIEFINTH